MIGERRTGGVVWWTWVDEVKRGSDVIAHAFAGEDELALVVCGAYESC